MRIFPVTISLLLLCCFLLPTLASAANISATDKYVWSETSGWSNFAATNAGVSVYDDHLEGFAWAENIGWIKLGSYTGGGYFTYANSSNRDWGINLNGAALSGFAWSETAGWINFAPTNGGVSLDPATGVFDGYAWAENLGWVHFKGTSPAYQLTFIPLERVNDLAVDQTDAQKLRATVAGSGIHFSSNGGTTWTAASSQPTDRRLKATVADPTNPTTLFTASHGSGIFTSSDNGDTWAACTNTGLNLNAYGLTIDSNGSLYATTKGGIFTSSDACASWTALNSGLPQNAGFYRQSVIAIDATNQAQLYTAFNGSGVYTSSDNGSTWLPASTQPGTTDIRSLIIKGGSGSTLFAASYGGGVFVSNNSGAGWATCSNTGLSNLNLLTLRSDAAGKLYAGSEAGVFVSSDDCASWQAMNTGLPN